MDFKCTSQYVSSRSIGLTITRELADIMFIVFSKKENTIRLTYLQNKVGLSSSKFKADLFQLNLLKDRLPINSNHLPSFLFGNRYILTNSVLPSIASYGVFYKDNTNQKIDMSYFPANNLKLKRKVGNSSYRTIYFNEHTFESSCTINGFVESQGERNLSGFGNALVGMKIGSPILHKFEDTYKNMLSFLSNNSIIFNESDYITEDTIPKSQILIHNTFSVPFTCIINADKCNYDFIL